jgi:lipid II:glycine glycyltransferase (peptidoglycan interpeptide bridge formation enzyme)
MAFYWHNGSLDIGKKLFAPTLCIWEAILECKRRRLKVFDFEGLYDERFPNKNTSWKGFSRFKLGFSNI